MLAWLCDNLDLPLFRETAWGVEANPAALVALGAPPPMELINCMRRLFPGEADHGALLQAFAQARAGSAGVVRVDAQHRILCLPEGPGRAAAVVAPLALDPGRLMQPGAAEDRKATAADLSAGLTHELANTLGAIAGWARLAQSGQRVSQALELIERSAESAWATARGFLLDLSGKPRSEPSTVTDLSSLASDVTRLIRPKADENSVGIQATIPAGLMVKGERGAHWSVLWNLAANAVEAMPGGGTLTLALRPTEEGVCLTVSDTGDGMSADEQAHIFDLYFTTKPQGTGIGLPLVKRTVDELGGTITCHSRLGCGTLFEVWLPTAVVRTALRASRDSKRASGVFMTEPPPHRYLVVDDDPALREMIATALQTRGLSVVAVGSAQEALAQAGPFAGTIVDLLLADARGDQLIADLRTRGLTRKALLITGTELPRDLLPIGTPDAVLRKPFDLEALFEALVELQAPPTAKPRGQASCR